MGIMIKLKDEISGGITVEGKISKPLTEQDRWRLNHASNLARKILIQAGCNSDSVFVGPLRGTHPSGTARIGDLLSTQLETPIRGLYVSDASCFPEALDRPTVLTLIALSKRLAKHLLSKDKPKAKARTRTKAAPRKAKTKKKAAGKADEPAAKPPSESSPAED
jgi:choline dehydrogenase-like flavoprotein